MTDISPPPAVTDGREDLRRLCGGAVFLPDDVGYDDARTPWNRLAVDRPAAVAYPAFAEEVSALVRAAARLGLRVAPQGTGHGAMSVTGSLGDAVLLRTAGMTELAIDAGRGSARVGAGVRWGDVIRAAGAVGLAGLHMSSPDVGVVGSTLGGGLSFYARRLGLQCSTVTAVEVVLADGTAVRATETSDADLLWAARGGGGGFGVVTAMEFDLFPITRVYAGMMVWDWRRTPEVLTAWARWADDAPDAATTVARVMQVPPDPSLPSEVRGRQVVVIDGAILVDDQHAATLLRPLRALRPDLDTFAEVAAPALVDLHMEGSDPAAVYANSILLADLTDHALAAIVDTAGAASGSRLATLEIRHLGGAVERPSPRRGALDHLDGSFLVLGLGIDEDRQKGSAQRDDARRVLQALSPWGLPGLYLPMVEDETDVARGWNPETWRRLQAVRDAADPGGLFVVPHLG